MSLKEKLKTSKLSIGAWQTLAHPAITEIYTKSGFEWIVVDLEHSVISLREAEEIIRITQLAGLTSLVRLSSHDPVQIARVLDAGAKGIIAPQVNTAEQAEAIVRAAYYPPAGIRGTGLARASGYGTNFQNYRTTSLEETIVIPMIEHIDAVKNMEKILSVKNVDAFLVGPYDLSASLGIAGQFDHPNFTSAMDQISETRKKLGKTAGIHVVEPNVQQLVERAEQGYRFIAYSLDTRMLDTVCRQAFETLRGLNV
jgi:2-keto-3-deoxy-L-rhamnonate aldolase RhmA